MKSTTIARKNPSVFHRPKQIPFGQNFRPRKISWTSLSIKYVEGGGGGGSVVLLLPSKVLPVVLVENLLYHKLNLKEIIFNIFYI